MFTYQEDAPNFTFEHLKLAGQSLGQDWQVTVAGDYDGDGKRDWIYTQSTSTGPSHTLALSACGSQTVLDGFPLFVGFASLVDALPSRDAADVDGDGRVDLMGTSGGYLAFGTLGTCSGWSVKTANLPVSFGNLAANTIDYDGDGLVDVRYWDATASKKRITRRTSKDALEFASDSLFVPPASASGQVIAQLVRDLNGDGLVDTMFDGSSATSTRPRRSRSSRGSGRATRATRLSSWAGQRARSLTRQTRGANGWT